METTKKKPWKPAVCPKDCVYRAGEYGGCSYIFMEDRMRGCDPGRDCIRYKPRGRAQKRAHHTPVLGNPPRSAKRTKWDSQRGYALWLTGMNDRDIARELGISAQSVGERRRKHWMRGEV